MGPLSSIVLEWVLPVWLGSAVLTALVHGGVSLAIDRRISLGLWEQLALAVFVALGPLGFCCEVLLVARVLRDIRSQLGIRQGGVRRSAAGAPMLQSS